GPTGHRLAQPALKGTDASGASAHARVSGSDHPRGGDRTSGPRDGHGWLMARAVLREGGIDDRLEWTQNQGHFRHSDGAISSMPKTAPLHEIALPAPAAQATRFRWLYDELRSAIVAGTLVAGARLPSTRSVARQHGIGRGTVVAVFEQLVAEGYLESIVGSGTFVSAMREVARDPGPKRGASREERSRAGLSSRGRLIAKNPFPPLFTSRTAPVFRLGQPAVDAFPARLWGRIAARRLRHLDPTLLTYMDPR